MTKIWVLGAVALMFSVSSVSIADETRIDGNREPADYFLKNEFLVSASRGTLQVTNGTTVDASVGYFFRLIPMAEVGIRTIFQYQTFGLSNLWAWDLLPTVMFNYPTNDLENAFFLGAGMGFEMNKSGTLSNTQFAFRLDAGKRFHLLSNVSYRPAVVVTKVTDFDMQLAFEFLSFTIMF